ncbi:PAS domain S-box-containing protein/diguanylate cyclase (GGDEF) domain-containing protein [Pseudomonas cuatrocienegasensis]|uniref:PAS domain S-box-containing protein/diguanylate cyclase (GGDEF) domain-containing protein n=1 Tax=Pseudomonas cuatrocienegasensis TaxID=543360 RepID=A0ABY1BPF5_9PSED|nr:MULTISPECIES: EAL domain-containing protein [Pseudomonas]OEC33729.1 diguanylate phosphodiesterase [Pseudomonas sp. 21C1]SER31056.1 PAS domain S-box-containing protein/diguanylate cyclase (GGDEF) domain-containing protein [Pseudomonas cuatrocienegasensis]
MSDYPRPLNDEARIGALDALDLLGTPPEREFERIVQMASRIFDVPIALVSLVHRDQQFFKARIGLDVRETSRELSFCTHAIMGEALFIVPDALEDERFKNNALVTGAPHIRFYAGMPLRTAEGHALGSLCLIDDKPRHDFTSREQQILRDLAALVNEHIDLRRFEREGESSRSRFRHIAATSPDGIICANSQSVITSWNTAAESLFGYTAQEALGQPLDLIIPLPMRAPHAAGFGRVAAGGPPRLIGAAINLSALRRDGSQFPVELSLSQWHEGGERCFGAIIRDITVRAAAEKQLKYAAEHDHLTGLANRSLLKQRIQQVLAAHTPATLLLIDLDGFKDVNDTLGHSAGDFVLQVVAARLRQAVAGEFMVSRLGGDEFVVFVTGTTDLLQARALGLELIAIIEEQIEYDEQPIFIGASVGIAASSGAIESEEQLLGNADLALYQAKSDGRHLVNIFTPELRQTASRKGAISSSMRQAWERREFELYYQPQINLADGSLCGAEALIRWNHPTLGVTAPAVFLPVLEAGLLAVPVGEWILRTACRQAAQWRQMGVGHFRMGVNLFAAQFRARDFADMVKAILAEFNLPASALELEITENTILRNEQRIMQPLQHLRDLGVGIAFDDFGTGFASLSLLKDYPVSRLKIDRSFVSGADRSSRDEAIIEAVTRLAAGFHLEVIAEGIETLEQAALMRRYDCGEGQGYLYGRPMTADDFARRYLSGPALAAQ